MAPQSVLTIADFTKEELVHLLEVAIDVKANPKKYWDALHRKTLLMLFEKPSLRTRVSFEVGMTQLGGHAIFYSIHDSPLGKKESISDTAKVLSRFCDAMIARLNKRSQAREFAQNLTIPFINALDDFAHPTQMLADLLTIREKRGTIEGIVIAYFGDIENNVTYDLMRLAAILGWTLRVSGPNDAEAEVWEHVRQLSAKYGGSVTLERDAVKAIQGADVVYTDSWMSYGIPQDQLDERAKYFMPYQVTAELMGHAKPDAIFMNCLPAARGMEQTAEVVDGPQSVVFDEAENRLHAHKAMLLYLLGADKQPQ